MRLIDADALEKTGIPFATHGGATFIALGSVRTAPTIEAEPVRHGRWIERLDGDGEFVHHMCSECKGDAIFEYIVEDDYDEGKDGGWYCIGKITTGIEEHLTDYCPHCGAKMEGDNHGNVEM